MKNLIFLAILVFLVGCAGGPVSFQDGTWSKCTLTMADGLKRSFPFQLYGAPLEWEEKEGSVACEPIPKVDKPEETTKTS